MATDPDTKLLWILGITVVAIIATYWVVSGGADAIGISDNSLVGYAINAVGDTVQSFTSTAEGRLQKLEPTTQGLVRQVIADLNSQGYQVTVGETLRTVAAEKADVAAGKSSATQVYSWHNIGRAVDLYMVDPATGSTDYAGANDTLYQALANTATSYGFRSLAYNADGSRHYLNTVKGSVWDGGHIEYHGDNATLAAAIASEGPTYGIG
jgi:hypothetical protein